jgi:uncharacterized damage-inducible protein DinB
VDGSVLATAFDHHVWATLRVIDACLGLSADELATDVPGTRGPIVDTLRHLVESDAFDLFILTGDRAHDVETGSMSLPEVRGVMGRNGAGWTTVLAGPLDADAVVREVDPHDGFQRWAPLGYRLAGTLEHGADHRSQIRTALTTIGVEPPRTGVFDLGVESGLIVEQMPDA